MSTFIYPVRIANPRGDAAPVEVKLLVTAEQHLRRALEVATEFGRRPLVARCHLSLGELYGKVGKPEQGREHLSAAVTMFSDMGMHFWLAQTNTERQRLDLG